MKFSKEFLLNEEGKTIEDVLEGHSRWSLEYRRVFEHEGKFYSTTYRIGATEIQDESPYEYDEDEIECREVHPVQKTITVYE